MADLELQFKTHGELEGAKAFAAELERGIGKAKAMGKDTADLERQLLNLNTALAASEDRLKGQAAAAAAAAAESKRLADEASRAANVGNVTGENQAHAANVRALNEEARAAEGTGGAIVGLTAKKIIAGAAAAALMAVVKKSVGEYADAEEAVTSLDAALAAHGNLVEGTRQKYQKLASGLEEVTAIADDEWIRALATLTKFGAMPEEIEPAAEAVKNLAGLLGGDLQSAAFAVGKAMQGQFAALSRLGIQVDDTKSHSEKLASVFEQLAQRGGGQLEARAATLRGQLDGVKIAAGNVLEGFGNLVSKTGVLEFAMEHLRGGFEGLALLLPGVIEQNAKLKNKTEELAQSMIKQAEAERELKEAIEEELEALERKNKASERAKDLANALVDAQAKTRLAEIDIAEAEGKLTPEQAALAKAQVQDKAAVSAGLREQFGRFEREGALKAALANPNLDPKARAGLQSGLADVQAEIQAGTAQLGATRAGGRAGVAQAEAGIRRAGEREAEEAAREAEKAAKESEQAVKRLHASTRRAGDAFRDGSDVQTALMERLVRDNVELQQKYKMLESRLNAGRALR